MTKTLKEVDVVIIGLGWTGGILSKELSKSGLNVVALERGAHRSAEEDFTLPRIRDELQYAIRHGLMQDMSRDTITVRNDGKQTALPMRQLGSFLPGEGLGGAGAHWNGHTWRWTNQDLKIRSMYEERYGKSFIPADMTIQDWGLSYEELEPYYDRFEKTAGISGQAGKVKGQTIPGGNPFEADRKNHYPLPPLERSLANELFAEGAKTLGWHPFPMPVANASQAYTNPDGAKLGQCQYCGFCERFGCEANAKASPLNTVIPFAMKESTFELRTHSLVTQILTDKTKKKVTGVRYIQLTTGEEFIQPAGVVILSAYVFSNVHLLLTSGIGEPYSPETGKGVVGKNYAYQTGAAATLFFKDKVFNPFMSTGGLATMVDDFFGNWDFDRSPHGFVGGFSMNGGMYHGRPIEYHPVPPGTPRWGKAWKEAMATWYSRSMSIGAAGTVMANRYNYLDLDPTYKTATGLPLLRMTFDYKQNEHRISTLAAEKINTLAKALHPDLLSEAKPRTGPWSVVPYQTTHNTGGTIMGTDPSNSVVNKYCQSWEFDNLFIQGASLFPHNSAYNPTGPVGALSYWTADALLNRYFKNPGSLV